MAWSLDDHRAMRAALALARRGLGNTWPNPTVGCVIIAEGQVVARALTGPGGRPHAETQALTQAGAAADGATAYVTLEPCAHHGKTPPCARALIDAGIRRVVVALEDPDPRVCGKGLGMLAEAGLRVDLGLGEEEAAEINAGFLMRVQAGRPLVTLKLATSLDGRIATHTGESRWITGTEARARAHLMRAQTDAIAVGSETAIRDNPALTCRLPGLAAHSPVRVVFDSRLRLPLTHHLVAKISEAPTWIVTRPPEESQRSARHHAFEDCGVEVIDVQTRRDGRPDPAAALKALGERGITRLLVEGGGHFAASLLEADLVDRIAWFRAGMTIGDDGVPAIAGYGLERLAEARRFERTGHLPCGEDVLETFRRKD